MTYGKRRHSTSAVLDTLAAASRLRTPGSSRKKPRYGKSKLKNYKRQRMRQRMRHGGSSYVKTSKTKLLEVGDISSGSKSISVKTLFRRGKYKNIGKRGEHYEYTANSTQRITSPIGIQSVQTPWTSSTVGALQTCAGQIETTAVSIQTQRSHYKGVTTIFDMTNCSNRDIRVTIYELTAKRDMAIDNVNSYDPIQLWQDGLANQGGTAAFGTIDQVPTESARFNVYWKVDKKVRINMSSGCNHKHTSIHKINGNLNDELLRENGLFAVRGWTRAYLFVTYGQVENDKDTKTIVSIGASYLDVICTQKYSYTASNDAVRHTKFVNSLPQQFPAGGEIISEKTGLKVDDIFS